VIALSFAAWLAIGPGFAQSSDRASVDDPVRTGLSLELQRSIDELALDDAEPPYFIAYRLVERWRGNVRASLGAIDLDNAQLDRDLLVEARVGSVEDDSANFAAGFRSKQGIVRRQLVMGDVADAIRKDAWLATDQAYKEAVENLSAKQAADARRSAVDDDKGPPEFTIPEDPNVYIGEPADKPRLDDLRERVVAASERFREHPRLALSSASGNAAGGRVLVLDTGGTDVQRPYALATIQIAAQVLAEDGSRMSDSRLWHTRTVEELPDGPVLDAEIDALAESLVAWTDAEIPDEPLIGPVLIEGDAAVQLFHDLLLPALEGTPQKERPSKGSRMFDFSSGGSTLGVKRRILPPGWAVRDDAAIAPNSPAAVTHDAEGTPVQPIDLVVDGIVQTHYASRTPSDAVRESNGHGILKLRSDIIRGGPMVTAVRPPRVQSDKRLHKLAMKRATAYGNDSYIVIRRFKRDSFGLGRVSFSARDATLSPVEIVRVARDGTETRLRNVRLDGLDRRALRDIAAAGTSSSLTWADGISRVHLEAPAVLLEELEVKPNRESVEKPPPLAPPLAR
jgi:predicted Zn-dependent protease